MIASLDPSSIARACHMGWSAMRSHFYDELPNEAVGLLYENGYTIRLVNQARSSHRFSVGEAQFMEAINSVPVTLELVGLYHTHPANKLTFSEVDYGVMTDQFEAGYPYAWVLVTEHRLKIAHVSLQDSAIHEFDLDPTEAHYVPTP